MRRFIIAHHSEEGVCEHCGWPLDVGDGAYLSDGEHMACSRGCAERLDRIDAQDAWHEGCEDSEPSGYGYVPT